MLVIESLKKSYFKDNRLFAVDGVDLEIKQGELFTLLGPSGCGKTTTLRCVAGLESPTTGRIALGNQTLFDGASGVNVPPERRGLGMMFQSYAVWPHMTVRENVSFPLEVGENRRKYSKKAINDRVDRALDTVELLHLADRSATQLSGGQQQRLALARAIVTEPPLLLLDEPLSNLDAKLRVSMRGVLKRLQRELGITSIYVTHDQSEALYMSSRIAVMRDGVVEQLSPPRELYEQPRSKFVAEFIGQTNLLEGVVVGNNGDTIDVKVSDVLLTGRGGFYEELAQGDTVSISIRPEHVGFVDTPVGPENYVNGEVLSQAFQGEFIDHVVQTGAGVLRCRTNTDYYHSSGTPVTLSIDPRHVYVLPSE